MQNETEKVRESAGRIRSHVLAAGLVSRVLLGLWEEQEEVGRSTS
jgi:hypothetical protein